MLMMFKIIAQMMKAVMIKIIVQMMMFGNGGSIYGPIAIEVILPSARFKERPKKVTNQRAKTHFQLLKKQACKPRS